MDMHINVYCFLAQTLVILFYVNVDPVIDSCTNVLYVIACINIPLFCVVCLFRDANTYKAVQIPCILSWKKYIFVFQKEEEFWMETAVAQFQL